MKTVIGVQYIEVEFGWGARPNGWKLFKTEATARRVLELEAQCRDMAKALKEIHEKKCWSGEGFYFGDGYPDALDVEQTRRVFEYWRQWL